ncbi:Glycoside hydrolase family 5 [uncultured Paludibacter sp.]|uniref:Glycoside hydrolase family 5 n=1 Tax=uncultured Paludibacter sp. TaxID=497635 RepID=A0A653AGY6_9BACT|nr:Glycoside hydrolase family 5 [uncultured Paludibacter sp.]
MRKITLFIVSFIVFFYTMQGQIPFSRGVNLTGWFQTSNARQIQFSKYTKKDFQNIKSLGCDVIRLPINLFGMTSGNPDYTLDPLFLEFLDEAVNWAEELQMHLILDNHSTDDLASKNPDLESILVKVWTQMAEHFSNRSQYISFEIMNEPNGITTQTWGEIQQKAINAIRASDKSHFIIVGGASWNTYSELSSLPYYTDTKLIYTFHFYDPFVFTHQGATWSSPSMASLANVPFPYNASTMPSTPSDLVGTWIESALNNYKYDGNVAKVKSLIDLAVNFKTARNANVYCGEFGVYIPNSNDADRVFWYSEVRKYLEEKGIPWTTWDFQNGFGLFQKGSNELFDYDVNIPLINALGLNSPPQKTYTLRPDSVGFPIYTDFIGEKILESSNLNGGSIDFYSSENPNNGKRCLLWRDCNQYGTVGFDFQPDKDLSQLRGNTYALSLLVRGNSSNTSFDLRFIDTKTGSADHPWRMNYTINDSKITWDNKWHKLYIPLTNFYEGGSWDTGNWYNPIGAFDWKAVDRFEIVSEQGSLSGKKLWFDNIQIANMDTAKIYENSSGISILSQKNTNLSISPNPVINNAEISYTIYKNEDIDISIYNLSGQKIETIINKTQNAGTYTVDWNRTNTSKSLKSGVYICCLKTKNQNISIKLILI